MQEINHFDVLVHPDFHLMRGLSRLTPSHIVRRKRWEARVEELGNNPQSLMLYFSAFLRLGFDANHAYKVRGVDRSAYESDKQRVKRFEERLGNRLIFFPGDSRPSKAVLEEILKSREFLYISSAASLMAYGEYEGACVNSWKRHLMWVLDLSGEHSHISKELSMPACFPKVISLGSRLPF